MKDNIYPVIVFNGHVFAFFETNDLKEVCILFFYLHNTNTKVITQCEHQSPKRKLSYVIHPFFNEELNFLSQPQVAKRRC